MKYLLKKKVSVVYLPFALMIGCVAVYFYLETTQLSAEKLSASGVAEKNSASPVTCDYTFRRLNGYEYIKPLLFVEQPCESERYAPIKADIERKVDELKQSNELISASVYFRDLKSAEWISYNDTEEYYPGSLMKLVLLIAYLEEEEIHPGILQKQFALSAPVVSDKHPVYTSKSIEIGKSYSVSELLRYMISYSDNNASYLLSENVDQSTFMKTITDMGLPAPSMESLNYPITARNYSHFMRTVYNSSYLSIPHSEFAAELLSTCDFTQGFAQSMPSDVKMIHKFGEAGDANIHQLHESGIIYLQNKPYLLTVMTKGKDLDKLPEVIRSISALVYQEVSTSY